MNAPLIRRNVTDVAKETLTDTPITVISGARQVGKSTLMHSLSNERDSLFINLDSAVDRAAAESDPDGFARQYPQGTLAIDEIQRVPALLTSLKAAVDDDKRPGRFIVTGSADLLSVKGSQESLAGRAQTIHLEGFSQGELAGTVEDFASWMWRLPSTGTPSTVHSPSRRDYLELSVSPTFPELRTASTRSRTRWLDNYVDRVLSKDTADITGIAHPDRLFPLLDLIAARNASEFVMARAAQDVDIPARTIPSYLRALSSVFLIRQLPGWSNDIAKRAVQAAKVMLADTGLAAHLGDIDADGMERDVSSSITGGLLEGFVTSELSKQRSWSGKRFALSHFRDNHGHEVDIVLEDRRRTLVGLEVKAATTVGANDFKGLKFLRDKVGDRFIAGAVLYTGTRAVPFGDRLWALPIATLWEH